jgi:Na+-transporting NADH:ubiquinone oxidoreductase subunit NqrC
MTTLIALFVVFISLFASISLAALMYLMVFVPIQQELKSLRATVKNHPGVSVPSMPLSTMRPENFLPDMDDIPLDALYGDEETDYKTTPEEVEDAIAERTFNTYNNGQTTSKQQLGSLKM